MKRHFRKWLIVAALLCAVVIGAAVVLALLPDRGPQYHGRPIMAWSHDLNSPDPLVRSNAAAAVRAIGAEAVPLWTAALQQKDPIFKSFLQSLARKCPFFVRRALRRVIRPFDAAEDRLAAVRALETIDPRSSVEPLLIALKESDALVASVAVAVLGRAGKPAVPGLSALLGDPDPEVRSRACSALSMIGPDAVEAVPALLQRLNDSRTNLQSQARFALGRIGGPALQPVLDAAKSPDSSVRATAVIVLGFVSPLTPPAVSALIAATRDPSADVRLRAIEVLGSLRHLSPEMLTALAHALRDSETAVRLKALDALSKGGGPFAESAVHSVLPLLEDPDPAIRLGAITVLEQIGPNAGAAMPSLKSRLADSDNAVRSRATNALLRIEPAALRQPD